MSNCIWIDNGMCVSAFGKAVFCCMIHDQGMSVADDLSTYNERMMAERSKPKTDGWLDACGSCKKKEDSGATSRRMRYIDKVEKWGQARIKKGKIQFLDISFGNTCNQMCSMCSSAFSSKWLKRDKKMLDTGITFRDNSKSQHGALHVPEAWHLNQDKLDEILSMVDEDTIQCDIKGGEPLYDKMFEYFCKGLIERSPRIRISVSTNLTKLSDERLEFIKTMPEAQFGLSIDGIGKTYEFVRGWHDWNIIDRNTRRLAQAIDGVRQKISINFTLMRYNMDQLPAVYDYLEDVAKESGHRLNLYLGQIATSPRSMSPAAADPKMVLVALEGIDYVRNKKSKHVSHALLDSLENYCYSILDNRPQIPQNLIDNAHKIMVEERGFDL